MGLFSEKGSGRQQCMGSKCNDFSIGITEFIFAETCCNSRIFAEIILKCSSLVVVYNGLCVSKYFGTVKFLPIICLLRHPTCIHEGHFISSSNGFDCIWQEFSK